MSTKSATISSKPAPKKRRSGGAAPIEDVQRAIDALRVYDQDVWRSVVDVVQKAVRARKEGGARGEWNHLLAALGAEPDSFVVHVGRRPGHDEASSETPQKDETWVRSDIEGPDQDWAVLVHATSVDQGQLRIPGALRVRLLKPEGVESGLLEAVRSTARAESLAVTLQLQHQVDTLRERLERLARTTGGQAVPGHREIQLFDADKFGANLGVTAATVRQRERKREVFSYLPGHRQRGRVYPSFQLWDGVAGEPLRQILRILGDTPSGRDATFFAAINPDLIDSTPVEVLIGERLSDREDTPAALKLLKLAPERRLQAVLAAARKFLLAGA